MGPFAAPVDEHELASIGKLFAGEEKIETKPST
jgi:hypothetical protein